MTNKNMIKKALLFLGGIAIIALFVACNTSIDNQYDISPQTIERLCDDINKAETLHPLESPTNVGEKQRELILKALADKEYPDVPEPFDNVLRQYEQIIMVTEGLNWEEAWYEFQNNDWQYVYDLLYGAGRYDNIYYSFHDLTDDGFPEMIMGKIFEDHFCPYLIYYYDGYEVWMDCMCERYNMAFYEDDIVELVGPTNIMYLQFKAATEKWELVEYLEIRYEGDITLGYFREDLNNSSKESVYEDISEEEYQQIIEQYRTTPIDLEWTVLWEVVG